MQEEAVIGLKDAVRKAAQQAETRWNKLLDADDIEQELWMFIVERPATQNYLRGKSSKEQLKALRKTADSICSKEKLDYERFTGNFLYTPADVRRILSRLAGDERILDDEAIDFGIGFEALEDEHFHYYEAVRDFYFLGRSVENKSDENLKRRCVDKLAELMNRKRSQREADRTEGLGTKHQEDEEWVDVYE
ncbi:hypothetical protein R3O64_09795 [Corynebacterium hesseae]|uniref:hypothetical protein n=1 Tax=Corynebacterium hesseae TaxID=2913502 RepID=UPI0030D24914